MNVGQCFGHQVDSSAVSNSGRTASISLRRASRNGGSFRSRPSDSTGSSTVKPAAVEILGRVLGEGLQDENPCIVHQHIDSAEPVYGSVYDLRCRFWVT